MLKTLLKPKAWVAKLLLVVIIGGFLALGYWGYLEPIKAFLDGEMLSFKVGETRFSAYILLKAAITIIVLFWVTGIFSDFGENRIKNLRKIKASNRALIAKAYQIVIYFLGFIVGLDVLGVDLTALAIFSGAIGIGLGFGLQKITSNFISGIILLLEKTIETDDLIELADGTAGYVKHTGARYTLISAFDGKEIMIPNENFITGNVTNWTYSDTKGRVEILVGVSYDSDIEKARELILEAATEHERCIADPEPNCFLTDFADSSVNFLLYFWVADVNDGRNGPRSDVMRAIWKKFKEHNIEIPFPQRDITIKNAEAFRQ